jgi:vesicle coat complex subunit
MISGAKFFDGGYYAPNGANGYNVYDSSDTLRNTVAHDSLNEYIDFLKKNQSANTGDGNYFNSDEFKSFKQLSLDLAQKAEDRDQRLMDRAAVKRNEEYQRNYREASNLFNAGQSISYSPRGQASGL